MPIYEYKVVPAPEKGLKGKGIKGPRERFAHALATVMNDLGAEGWEYLRADTLPCEERSGLTGSTTTYQNMLVFRRELGAGAAERPEAPALLPAPKAANLDVPEAPAAPAATAAPAAEADKPRDAEEAKPSATKGAAAAAAAAALTAYRESNSGFPTLGPAPERNGKRD